MYIEYLYGNPVDSHIYKFGDDIATKELEIFGSFLVRQAGIIDEKAFKYREVNNPNKSTLSGVVNKPLYPELTCSQIEDILARM